MCPQAPGGRVVPLGTPTGVTALARATGRGLLRSLGMRLGLMPLWSNADGEC
jgi:hypothetical protein